MQIETRKNGHLTIIKPNVSELDFAKIQRLQTKVIDLLNDGERNIILDLAEIKELDSTGVSALIHIALNVLAYPEAKFGCIHAAPSIEKILQLTHIDNLFPLYYDEKKALEAILPTIKGSVSILYLGKPSTLFEDIKAAAGNKLQIILCEAIKDLQIHLIQTSSVAIFMEEQSLSKDTLTIVAELGNQHGLPVVLLTKDAKQVEHKPDTVLVVETPLTKEEIGVLINEVVRADEDELSEIPISEGLFKKYAAALPEKLDQLETLVNAAVENPRKDNYESLIGAAHKLAGSAGSYGYIKAGEVCKSLELLLKGAIQNSELTAVVPEIKNLFRRIKFYFNVTFQSDLGRINRSLRPVEKGTIFLVSHDESVVNAFKKACEPVHAPISFESNPEKALDSLKNLSHKPELLLVEKSYQESRVSGLDLIRKIKNEMSVNSMKLGLIVDQENLEDRLQASSEGIDIIIKKPVALNKIEQLLDRLIEKKQQVDYRVLVVDDDDDVCNYIKSSLNSINVTVMTLSDETKILDALYGFQPQLLLLDINLPQYDGLKLLKAIRSDLRYKDLKIIMITAGTTASSESYRDAFDDFWSKPLNQKHLQEQVLQFARTASSRSAGDETELSIFDTSSKFKKAIQPSLQRGGEKLLVIFGSQDFKVASQEGTGAKKEYLIACENVINQAFPEVSRKGYLGEGKFALLCEGVGSAELEAKLDQFIADSEYRISVGTREMVYNTFSVLVVRVEGNDVQAERLVDFAVSTFEKSLVLPSQRLTVVYGAGL